MDFDLKTGSLTAKEFVELFNSVSWGTPCEDQVSAALQNSLAVFSIHNGGKAVAMARIVGDGAMTFFIKDVVVSPEYQRKGLGRLLLSAIEDYITQQISPGWTAWAELMSADGKEDFYKKFGYVENRSRSMGSGMMKKIRR